MKTILRLLALLPLLFACEIPSAQTLVNQQWADTSTTASYKYHFVTGLTDNNGNTYILSNNRNNLLQDGFTITGYDPYGNVLWENTYNNSSDSAMYGITMAADDYFNTGIYIAGVVYDSSSSSSDFITLRLDYNGNLLWTAAYRGVYGGYSAPISVFVDTNNAQPGVYVAGTEQVTASQFEYTIIKYDTSASQVWITHYDSVGLYNLPVFDQLHRSVFGTGPDLILYDVNGASPLSWNLETVTIAKLNGDIISKATTPGDSLLLSNIVGIEEDEYGDIFLLGNFDSAGVNRIRLVIMDAQLYIDVINDFMEPGSTGTYATGLTIDPVSLFVAVCGNALKSSGGQDALTVGFGLQGFSFGVLWSQTVSAPNPAQLAMANDIALDSADNVYITGAITIGTQLRYLTQSYDTGGNTRWQKTYSRCSTCNDIGQDIVLDDNGDPVVSGISMSPTDTTYAIVAYGQATTYLPPDTTLPSVAYAFYENRGQIFSDTVPADSVFYYTHAGNPQLYVGDGRLSYVLSTGFMDTLYRIDMVFENTNITSYSNANTYATEQTNDFLNYYLAHLADPITNVEGYSRIVEKNLYDYMDWQLYSGNTGMKSLFIYYPDGEGRSGDLEFEYTGMDSMRLNNNVLKMYAGGGCMQTDTVVAYQYDSAGNQVPVSVGFNQLSPNEFSFDIEGSYNYDSVLIIEMSSPPASGNGDSTNLKWSTFYGGDYSDVSYAVKTDHNNAVYMAGTASSDNFPVTEGPSGSASNNGIAFLVKFDSTDARKWATCFGGTSLSSAQSIAINSANEPIVCGYTQCSNTNFPPVTLTGAYSASSSVSGTPDNPVSFISEFDQNTGALNWYSYFTGTQNFVFFDSTDHLYMVGTGADTTFPYTDHSGAYYNTAGLGTICKFNTSLGVTWATGFGSTTTDASQTTFTGVGQGVDQTVYIVGNSEADNNFPIVYSGSEYHQANAGLQDGVVLQLSNNDSLLYSTFIGGSDEDYFTGVATAEGDAIGHGSSSPAGAGQPTFTAKIMNPLPSIPIQTCPLATIRMAHW